MDALCELLGLLGEDLVLHAKRRITGVDLTLNRANLEMSPEHRVLKAWTSLISFDAFGPVEVPSSGGPFNLAQSSAP